MAGQPLAEAYVRIDLDTRSFERGISSSQAAFTAAAASITRTARSMQTAVIGAFGAIAGAALTMKKAISTAREYDAATREIWTLMDISEKKMGDYAARVEELGVAYGQAGKTALRAFYQVVSAGYQGEEGFKVLQAAMKAATAGVTDAFTAVDVLTTVLNSYNLRADQALYVSDILFTIVKRGKTTFRELASTMGRLAGIAAPLGVTLEELGAALAFLTRTLPTEEAVTALRAAMMELTKPGSELSEVLQELGYSSGSAALRSEGFLKLLAQLAVQAKETGVPIEKLFGNIRSLTAIMPMTSDRAEELNEHFEAMQHVMGATEEAFGKIAEGIDFKMRQLSSAVSLAWNRIGELFKETAAGMAGQVAGLLFSFSKTVSESEEFRDSLRYILAEGLKLGALIAVLGGIFLALKALLTPTAALLAAFSALYLAVRWNLLNIGDLLEQFGKKVTGTISFALEFAGLEDFAEQIRSLGSSVERAIGMAVAGFAGSVLVRWLLKGLTKPSAFIGILPLAGAIAFELAMRWKKVTANAEQLANLITDTLGTVLGALVGFQLGGPFGAIFGAAAGRILAEGIELTIPLALKFFSKGETEEFFTEFNNQLVSLSNQLYETAQQGVEKVKESLQGALAYLSQALVSPEARANWEAVLETLRGYFENVKTIIASALPPEEAEKVGRQFAESLIGAVQDEKFKDLIEEIFRDWLSVSDEVKGQAEQAGKELGQAIQKGLASVDFVPELDVSAALSKAADLGKRMGAQLTDSFNDALGDFKLSVGFTTPPWLLDLLMKQEGGFVPGKGSGDRVPALLEPGEFVWPKELVRKYPEIIVGLWKKFRLGGFVGYQAGGAVSGGGGANQISGLAQGISRFLDMLDRLVSGMYDFLKPLVKGEENLAKFEADFEALRNVIDGLRQAAGDTNNVFDMLMQQTQNQAQAAINQANRIAGAGQAATDLAAKLEAIKFPSAEAGQQLRQLALESGRSAEDLIAIHAKAQDLISVAEQLYEAQSFFHLSTEETVSALRAFLSELGLSEAEINEIVMQIVGAGQDLASVLSSLVSQAETLTLAQTDQILALREQALAILESGRVVTEEGEARQATIGEIIAAAGAISSFASWLDAAITVLERLITAGDEAVRPLYEQLVKLKGKMALGPTFEEQRRAQEEARRAAERAAEEAKRRQEELARKAREAFEESFRAPVKKALKTGDWMEAALAVREMAKQKDDLIAQAKALPAVQGKTMELSEVYDLLIGAQRELLTSIDKEIAVRQIAGENVEKLEKLKTRIEELFDPLGEWKKALREAAGLMAEDPQKASQALRELFLKAKELGAGGAEAAALVAEGTRDQIRAYEEQIEDMELFGLSTADVRFELEVFKNALTGMPESLAKFKAALDLYTEDIVNLVGTVFGPEAGEIASKVANLAQAWFALDMTKMAEAGELFAQGSLAAGTAAFTAAGGLNFLAAAVELGKAVCDAVDKARQEIKRAAEEVANHFWDLAQTGIGRLRDKIEGVVSSLEDLIKRTEAYSGVQEKLSDLQRGTFDLLLRPLELVSALLNEMMKALGLVEEESRHVAETAKETWEALNVPAGFKGARYEWAAARPGEPYRPIEEASEEAGETLTWAEKIVKKFGKELGEAMKGLKEFGDAVRRAWDKIGPTIVEGLLPAVEKIGSWFARLGDRIGSDLLPVLTENLPVALAGFLEFFGGRLVAAATFVSDLFAGISPSLAGFAQALESLAEPMIWLAGQIAERLSPVLNTFLEALTGVVDWIRDVLVPDLGSFFEQFGAWWKEDVDPFLKEEVFPTLAEWGKELYAWIKDELLPFLKNEVWPFIKNELWPVIKEVIEGFLDSLRELWDSIKENWPTIKQLLIDQFESWVKEWQKKIDLATAWVEAKSGDIMGVLETIWTSNSLSLWDKVQYTFGIGLQWLTDAIGGVVGWIGKTVGGIVGGIGKTVGDIVGGVGKAVGGVVSGIGKAVGGFFDWLGGLVGLQAGGIVTRPTLAWLGEAGPEAVIPLNGFNYPRLGLAAAGARISIEVEGRLVGDGRELVGVIERVRARDEIVRGKR